MTDSLSRPFGSRQNPGDFIKWNNFQEKNVSFPIYDTTESTMPWPFVDDIVKRYKEC